MSRGPVEQAIAALRGGRAVRVEGNRPIAVASVETVTPELLNLLDARRTAPLLISGARAAGLSLANALEAADPGRPVLIARSEWIAPASALDLADPGRDFGRAPVGPLEPIALEFEAEAAAALRLARLAGLLPA